MQLEANLSDCRVQVVHDHQHDGGSLTRTTWVLMDGVSPGEGRRERAVIASLPTRNSKPCPEWSDVCYRGDPFDAVGITSWAALGRSGTCKCGRTAGALGQTPVPVLHGGKGGNSVKRFSKPTEGNKRHESDQQTGPGVFFLQTF